MGTAVAVLSGYFNVLLIFLYAVQAFLAARKQELSKKAAYTHLMAAEMYLLHFLCHLTLFIRSGEKKILLFYVLQLVLFVTVDFLYRRFYPNMSVLLFRNMLLLLSIGFVLLTRLDFTLAAKQFVMAAAAILLALIIPAFIRSMHRLERYGLAYSLIGIALLLLVFLRANERLGAKVWLTVAGITIQPSEFVKLSFIFGMAGLLLKRHASAKREFFHIVGVTALAAAHVLLLALSKDLGGALLFFVVYLVLLYTATRNRIYLAAGLVSGAAASVAAYVLFSHVQVRVLAWKDPFAVVDNEGYQLAQSLFAIGNGGFFGTGLLEGNPELVPVVTSDFIFAALCEEMGALFALGVLLVYVNCMVVLIRQTVCLAEHYYRLVFLGFITLFAAQIFLNVGGIIKMIPSTGVTLPFISYGGSSLCSMILMFQLIQGMQERTIEEAKKEETEAGAKRRRAYKGNFVPGTLKEGCMRTLLHSAYLSLILLAGTSAYFAYFMCTSARTVIYHSYNRRQAALAKQNLRGGIYAADGSILAETLVTEEENEKKEIRVYPYGPVFAHIVGQTQAGTSGLEAMQEIALLSSSIREGEKLSYRLKGEKAPGNNVYTTLEPSLQLAAYQALMGKRGAVCVMEPKTGRVLAAVSAPAFNPNEVEGSFEELTKEADSPLFNRALYGLYTPGSTFKLVTSVAYLRAAGGEAFSYDCTGTEWLDGVEVSCYRHTAHGKLDLKTAFVKSCNTAFAVIGEQIGGAALEATASSLLLLEPMPGELPYAQGSVSLGEKAVERVQAAFGQGTTQVTPYSMALLTAAVANDGILMKPYMVERLADADGNTEVAAKEEEAARLLSEEEAAILTDYMTAACEQTALAAFCRENGLTVAGKTGTAEYEENGELHNHAWFICFAPAEQPEIAISVLVEDAGLGNEDAVPVAEKILKEWLQSASE